MSPADRSLQMVLVFRALICMWCRCARTLIDIHIDVLVGVDRLETKKVMWGKVLRVNGMNTGEGACGQ